MTVAAFYLALLSCMFLLGLAWFVKSDSGYALAWMVVVGFALLIGGFAVGGRALARHYDAASCRSFGVQASRTVRFVDYTYWSWDCLTPTRDGKWISTDNLREFGDQP